MLDFIDTAGQWSWRLKSAKECVITYLPNNFCFKIDYATHVTNISHNIMTLIIVEGCVFNYDYESVMTMKS